MEDFIKSSFAKTIPKIGKGTIGRSLEVVETAEQTVGAPAL